MLFLVVILGPPLVERGARPGPDRPAPRRLPDRPQRPRAARRRQHHDPRPRPARPALPDVRRRGRARPRTCCGATGARRSPSGCSRSPSRWSSGPRRRRLGLGAGGVAAARLAARVAHARPLSAHPQRGAGERPDHRERGRRDGADRHDRADHPRRHRRHDVGHGDERGDRAAARARPCGAGRRSASSCCRGSPARAFNLARARSAPCAT